VHPPLSGEIGTPAKRFPFAFRADQEGQMSEVKYEIVEHDGGWAYKLNEVFSETFPTHQAALRAAEQAAAEQRVPGSSETIEYEDERGKWHTERAEGSDRPQTDVVDKP
jgi:uncharacterized protein DUF2188